VLIILFRISLRYIYMAFEKLNDTDKSVLREYQRNAKDRLVYIRVTVILMLDMGKTVEEVETVLGIDASTIYRYGKSYQNKGLDEYLRTGFEGYWGRLSCKQVSVLRIELKSRLYTTSKEVCDFIQTAFDITYTEDGVVKLLHRIGFGYKQTKQVPCECDTEKQEAFVKELMELVRHVEASGGKEAIYFTDGVHPTHNTRSANGWIEVGCEFEQKTVSGRDRVNINGAINALAVEDVKVVVCDSVNAQSTKELYKKILDENPQLEAVHIISDNARYYKNSELGEWINNTPIRQIFLPPYSPNLNPIERLWKYMRKKVINTSFFRKKEDFKKAIINFFKTIKDYKEDLSTLITLKFHIPQVQTS
jgi:transposase